MAKIKGIQGTEKNEISYQYNNKKYDKISPQKHWEMKIARPGGHARRKLAGQPYTKQIVTLSG
jgi:hypothetical protein